MSEGDPAQLPNASVGSEHLGVRVWFVRGASQQELVDNLAVILGEHMADGDELHLSYNAMQNGSQLRERAHLLKPPEQWTELHFEYSVLVVLRSPPPPSD